MGLRHAAVVAGLAFGLMSGAAQAAIIYSNSTPGAAYFDIGPGTYVITAVGAAGGPDIRSGGYGAEVTGTFTFTASETLHFLVGGMGGEGGGSDSGGGGGGGTFVVAPGNLPLLIAGGGGGNGGFPNGGNGGPVIDAGGVGGASGEFGGGGGGFFTNGEGGPQGGSSYINGGAGGAGEHSGGNGGIGGGGASSGAVISGGGGGGYTGGIGGGRDAGGQGGFSFNAGVDQSFSIASDLANGSVTISSLSTVPLPASAPMFGAALLVLGAVGYGVKRKKAAAVV